MTIIGKDNGLSPGRHLAIIWINAGTLINLERNYYTFIEENAIENVCEMVAILSRPQLYCTNISEVTP